MRKELAFEKLDPFVFVTKLAGFEHSEYIQPNATKVPVDNTDIPMVQGKNIREGVFVEKYDWYISKKIADLLPRSILNKKCILIPYVGSNLGEVGLFPNKYRCQLASNIAKLELKTDKYDLEYVMYYLQSPIGQSYLFQEKQGSSQPNITMESIRNTQIIKKDILEQKKIVKILSLLTKKIERNNCINHNLQQQVLAMYQKIFVDSPNDDRRICRADECFDISIGKTPPRKEAEWFKTVQADNIVWVSIADMGNCGLFIADSSEYLSPAAVKKFNVAIVPDNTVLLSFKLTVGRIAITDGWMTTNEAIAHFKTENKFINEYLYCYLKSYNFQTLGSTSSIATAVNSKIIKAMPFVVPTDDELAIFHNFAAPIFEKIKAYQHENVQLTRLRDSLLPKLMSGEIDVSDVVI